MGEHTPGSLLGMMLGTTWCNNFNRVLGTKLFFFFFKYGVRIKPVT